MDLTPVKPILLLLYSEEVEKAQAEKALEENFGPISHRSQAYPFDHTPFYEAEMGRGLMRELLAFEQVQAPNFLPSAKLICNQIEQDLAIDGKRRVNLDMGYLDFFKVVLASMKERGNKLYLDHGVWGDWVLRYFDGDWVLFEWTFPDFLIPRFYEDLSRIRLDFRHQLKAQG